MFKKAVFAFIALIIATPAQALPGWSGNKLKAWAKNHQFLSPYVQDFHVGCCAGFMAYRDLEDQKKLSVWYSDSGGVGDLNTLPMRLVKIFVVDNSNSGNFLPDLWHRESDKAYIILEKVYGKEIAEDFKNSKFIFQGIDAYSEESSHGNDRLKIERIPAYSNLMFDHGKVFLYKGNKFSYETNEKKDTLRIRYLTEASRHIGLIEHNARMYAKYQERENRKKPANIGL